MSLKKKSETAVASAKVSSSFGPKMKMFCETLPNGAGWTYSDFTWDRDDEQCCNDSYACKSAEDACGDWASRGYVWDAATKTCRVSADAAKCNKEGNSFYDGECNVTGWWVTSLKEKSETAAATESNSSNFYLGLGVGASVVAAAWATYAYTKKEKDANDYVRM